MHRSPFHRRRFRLCELELRLAPAIVNWTAGGNGDYGVASNWTVDGSSEHRVPLPTDDAVVVGTAVVTSSGDYTVNSLVAQTGFTINSGIFTINASGVESYLANLIVASGTTLKINGGASKVGVAGSTIAGNLQVENGSTLWFRRQPNQLNSGTMLTGPGQFLSEDDLSPAGNHSLQINANITAPTNLVLSRGKLTGSGELKVPSGATLKLLGNSGTARMEGAGKTTIDSGAQMVIGGDSDRILQDRLVTNAGTITYQDGGNFSMTGTAKIDNTSSGTFKIASTALIAAFGDSNGPFITNAGMLIKESTGTTSISPIFSNTGTIKVMTGTLHLAPSFGATISGAIDLTGGDLSMGSFNFSEIKINAGTTVSGAGALVMTGGQVNVNAPISVPNFRHTLGRLVGTGTITITNSGEWTGGETLDAGMTKVAAGATLTLSGPAVKYLSGGWDLTNAGTINHMAGGDIFTGAGSTITNEATGVYNIGDVNITFAGAIINNAGQFVKTGLATSLINHSFNNTGTVNVNSGTLALSNFGLVQTAGITNVAAGATLKSGDGTTPITVSGGTMRGNGTLLGHYSGTGKLSPGASPGKLTITDSYAFSPPANLDGAFEVELDGLTAGSEYDQLVVNGKVAITGSLNLSAGKAFKVGDTFRIIDNDGTDPVQGTFAGLGEGGTISAGGQLFGISYKGGTGNDVTLTRTVANSVMLVTINDGAIQRSRVTNVRVTFSNPVTLPSPANNAFTLIRQSDGAPVTLDASVDNSGPTTIVTLTFLGTSAVNNNSLADGRYTLTVLKSQVNGGNFDGNGDGTIGDDYTLASAANPLPPTNIWRLFGDNNADGAVTSDDFAAFRQTFGTSINLAFDFNNNGIIDSDDFAEFRKRFGIAVVP